MIKDPKVLLYPNLNGVRFIAAFWIVVHHIEQFKEKFGFSSELFHNRFILLVGPLSVFLFFVLSGFLITSLLLTEKAQTRSIDLRSFYKRRIFRILPLYYLMVFLGLFILPEIEYFQISRETEFIRVDFMEKIVLYVLILPNIVTGIFKHIPFLSENWSIGVEEQFYLVWPLVILKTKTANLLRNMFVCLIIIFVVRSLTVLYMPTNGWWKYLSEFIKSLRLTCMILGAIGAWLIHFQLESGFMKFIFQKRFQWFLYLILIVCAAFGVYIKGINQEFYSLIFILLLMNLAKNPNTILSLENPVFSYLGKISYGMYMYHTIAVVIGVKVSMYFGRTNWVIYSVTFASTILMAYVSYQYLEKPFLKLNSKSSNQKENQKQIQPDDYQVVT